MHTITRTGKIARLPKAVRDELNQRLRQNATGKSLVAWLNGLPEVRTVLEEQFGGSAIREQNLSQWKKGGYGDWLRREEAMEFDLRLFDLCCAWVSALQRERSARRPGSQSKNRKNPTASGIPFQKRLT